MKKFILLTSGRAGSTSFINSLARHDDIALPNKQIDCIDNEILHPKCVERYFGNYQELTGLPVNNESSLVKAFFESNKDKPFAGFKSMPNRHEDLNALVVAENIQIITLTRKDIASTIASFIIAIDRNTWRRNGGKQKHRFTFGPKYFERVYSHLVYIVETQKELFSMENSINIVFEDLCKKDFSNEKLDEYFKKPIKMHNPKPPISGRGYVANWNEFNLFVENKLSEINGGAH